MICEYLSPEDCGALGLASKEMWSKVFDDSSYLGQTKLMARKGVEFCVRHGYLRAALMGALNGPDFQANRVILAMVAMSPKNIDWDVFLSLVDVCIQKGVTDSVATSALTLAVSCRNVVLLQELVRAGATWTPKALSRAIDESFSDGVDFLLECGAQVTENMVEDAVRFSSEQVLESVLIAWDKKGEPTFPSRFLIAAVSRESILAVKMVLVSYLVSGVNFTRDGKRQSDRCWGERMTVHDCVQEVLKGPSPTSAGIDCLAVILHELSEAESKREPWGCVYGHVYGDMKNSFDLMQDVRRRRQKLFGPTH